MAVIPLTLACLVAVTQQYNFPRETMFALLSQEAGQVGESSANANGTFDHGPFQINDVNVKMLAERFGLDRETTRQRLRDDGCFSAKAAGLLLNMHWKASGDIWTAIGHYHSKTEKFATLYRARTYEKVERLYKPVTPKKKGVGG